MTEVTTEQRTTTASVKITTLGSLCRVESPYHPDFIKVARARNGKWSAPHWLFDARDESGLREECRRIYGTDGTPVSCVDCRLDYHEYGYFSGSALYALGRLIVERRSRDERVRLGVGVVAVEGGFPESGGSMKNPDPKAYTGTILEVRDVPIGLARRFSEYDWLTIISDPDNGPTAAEVKTEAIAHVKALMAELGVTVDDLQSDVNG